MSVYGKPTAAGVALHNLYYDSMMTRRFVQFGAWGVLAFIVFATVSPISERPHDFLPVQVDRALAFTLMTAGFIIAYPRHWTAAAALCVISAFGIEALQYLSPTRDPHISDADVKALGAVGGVFLGLIANRIREQFRRRLT